MRFTDLLKTTVLLSAGAATALAIVCLGAATSAGTGPLVLINVAWWVIAALVGTRIGRETRASTPIARLLADARTATSLPEPESTRILLNRLWPLLLSTIASGALGFVAPQIPGIACGFAIIWALAWRRQADAVEAIEERDGASFFVERTSPFTAISLIRAPGFRRERQGAPA